MSLVYEDSALALHRFVSGFANNAWLLVSPDTNESLIIDTPGNPAELIEAARSTQVRGILITHSHQDHLEGFAAVRAAFPAPVGIGARDAWALEGRGVAPSVDVSDGAAIRAGSVELRAVGTPGHTPGSTCYFLSGVAPRVFTGDTLFPGGPGRTGSPAAFRQILESIATRLLTLPESAVVHPGHGDDTTVAQARAEYEAFAARSHPEGLHGDVTWLSS